MDKIEALGSSIAQISLYDLKSYYNQAKAVVLNYTEMEAKVRDATNDDPWGASSTLMQEIAQGTSNFQQFNEIMPTIYKRFTEKEAREWRQIYKALQLLEYLIKHGSERVIDDARSHISMIKILRNFHYVDDKGKDQGINVRNRAKEISELLSDLDRVRQERRKAKASRNKYIGVGNEGPSFTSSTGSKYGGFGSDSGGFSSGGGNGGDDWNTGGSSRDRYVGGSSSFKQNDDFEEYDAGEWEDRPTTAHQRSSPAAARGSVSSVRAPSISISMKKTAEKTVPAAKAKEVDLFSMADEEESVISPPSTSSKTAPSNAGNTSICLDDDFDDFQSAPSTTFDATTTFSQSSAAKPNVFALLNSSPNASAPASQPVGQFTMGGINSFPVQQSVLSAPGNMNMFGSSILQPAPLTNRMAGTPNSFNPQGVQANHLTAGNPPSSNTGNQAANVSKATASNDFDDLFSFAGLSNTNTKSGPGSKASQPQISMAAMAREQSSASIWGGASANVKLSAGPATTAPVGSSAPMNANTDDLLL